MMTVFPNITLILFNNTNYIIVVTCNICGKLYYRKYKSKKYFFCLGLQSFEERN